MGACGSVRVLPAAGESKGESVPSTPLGLRRLVLDYDFSIHHPRMQNSFTDTGSPSPINPTSRLNPFAQSPRGNQPQLFRTFWLSPKNQGWMFKYD